jgi:hypothetical protein
MTFYEVLREQRWDDHRYYHHCRVNQSLHLLSALSFLTAYALLWIAPAVSVFIAWLVAMPLRQIGHFFFEPHGYDEVNQATHDHKEAIKVGYNLHRKVILLSIWGVSPLLVLVARSMSGLHDPRFDWSGVLNDVAMLWLAIGIAALIGRTVQLCLTRSVLTGLVWCTKILTDPFHDVKLYYQAPLQLMAGQRFGPAPQKHA